MKKMLLLMTFVICALGVNAQNTRVITGAVIDKDGNPLPNALVEATNGAESVTTDADGSFRIEVPIWLKSLTAKYAGFPEKKIKLNNQDRVLFEMKRGFDPGTWFLDAAYAFNIGDGMGYSRIGLMGGYLGNWGGYGRLMLPFGPYGASTKCWPSVTAGVIKQVSKKIYLFFGTGYAPVYSHQEYFDYYNGFEYENRNKNGQMWDIGAIFRFGKVNFSFGYSLTTGYEDLTNHAVQLSVGYCFR